jgi:hypothetical protein
MNTTLNGGFVASCERDASRKLSVILQGIVCSLNLMGFGEKEF